MVVLADEVSCCEEAVGLTVAGDGMVLVEGCAAASAGDLASALAAGGAAGVDVDAATELLELPVAEGDASASLLLAISAC
jgi:hypothetical protein